MEILQLWLCDIFGLVVGLAKFFMRKILIYQSQENLFLAYWTIECVAWIFIRDKPIIRNVSFTVQWKFTKTWDCQQLYVQCGGGTGDGSPWLS